MFGDMMGKLKEAQEKMEEIKKCLDTITVKGEAGGGAVEVIATGNRKIREIKINDGLMKEDKEQLEDLLITACNRALEQAEKISETEMQGAAKGILPNIPGLF